MAARLFTHGYDFFVLPSNLIYHLWSRQGRPSFRQINLADQDEKEKASQEKVHRILNGDKEGIGEYGLGKKRTLQEFEAYCGVNFQEKKISERARVGNLPPNDFADDFSLFFHLISQTKGKID